MSSSRSGAKLFVAFVALGGAFLIAHPFRQDGTRKVDTAPHTAEHVVLRETPAPGDVDFVRLEAPTAEIQPTLLAPPPGAAEPHGWNDEVARLSPPPTMARTYPSSAKTQDAAISAAGLRVPSNRRSMQRTHEVRDGDTLESLAQRYLGDRARWREIFQVNRDQIPQPELLPLAAKLVIPPKFPLPSSESSHDFLGKPVAQAPLVPLVPATRHLNSR